MPPGRAPGRAPHDHLTRLPEELHGRWHHALQKRRGSLLTSVVATQGMRLAALKRVVPQAPAC